MIKLLAPLSGPTSIRSDPFMLHLEDSSVEPRPRYIDPRLLPLTHPTNNTSTANTQTLLDLEDQYPATFPQASRTTDIRSRFLANNHYPEKWSNKVTVTVSPNHPSYDMNTDSLLFFSHRIDNLKDFGYLAFVQKKVEQYSNNCFVHSHIR